LLVNKWTLANFVLGAACFYYFLFKILFRQLIQGLVSQKYGRGQLVALQQMSALLVLSQIEQRTP
jgi:hypothetical protein